MPSFAPRGCLCWMVRSAAICTILTTLALPSYSGPANRPEMRILLPIEVLGRDGTVVTREFNLTAVQAESACFLWMQVHGLRYPEQASIQANNGPWIPLTNNTVAVAEPGKSFGGIGGGFATLTITLPLPQGTVGEGINIIHFRFNRTDGISSGYRVIAWNLLTSEVNKIIASEDFAEDAPESWVPPLPDLGSIAAGRKLWSSATLTASSLLNSPEIHAHCGDCHTRDGRDLKYFNFSNNSIIARSRFHGLSVRQGEQIASYIRSLPVPSPGRPWNPPYQPGPGLDRQPVSNWAAGAGLAWVLNQDVDALPHLLQGGSQASDATPKEPARVSNMLDFAAQITPELFRPDGDLNVRQIPTALQLPDWAEWLPRVHPKDAWGRTFSTSAFGSLYGSDLSVGPDNGSRKPSLQAVLAAARANNDLRPVAGAFAGWSESRRAFLRHFVNRSTVWSPELTNKVYSTQLWQLVKTWEIMQEYGLEGRGHDLFGPGGEQRTWCNTIPAETAPSAANIPSGESGVGGTALTNEYARASWYELQIILNSGNHRHRDRSPVDWVYVIGGFRDLYDQTRQPEPTRLLVATIKALQSTDPHLDPDNVSQGWHPEQNVDPRILISPAWAPIFKPLPREVHKAITQSLLSAWMDKNLQYSIAKYLPIGSSQRSYKLKDAYKYGEITGGNVWQAAEEFREAGVDDDEIERLQQWGQVFVDRAARIRY